MSDNDSHAMTPDELAIVRAALMEAGENPHAVFLDAVGRPVWNDLLIDSAVMWRAREVTAPALGLHPLCFECFMFGGRNHVDIRERCQCVAPHEQDCGASRAGWVLADG